ncbi:MAG TPA: hypothetical protein VJO34_04175 [Methylomirabilota bacterium]|nr:hypothetical protein [Methylomirabilota bacterium]
MKKSAPLSVAILGINGADSPSAGLILALSLRRQRSVPVRVIALVENPFTDGIQAINHADEVVVTPSPVVSPEGFIERIRGVARRFAPLVILPGGPSDWCSLIPLKRGLRTNGVSLLFPSESLVNTLLPFPDRGKLKGVATPQHCVLRSRDLRPLRAVTWRFPLRLQSRDGAVGVAATWHELEIMVAQHHAHSITPLLIQEIPSGEEISIAALGDQRGRPIGWVAARVLNRSENGAVWSAVTVDASAIRTVVKPLLDKFAWPGPLTLTFSFTAGGPCFTGIEPGFPSWISLASAAGQDLPLHYLRLALGKAGLAQTSYRVGLHLARVAVDQPTEFMALSRLVTQGDYANGNNHPTELRATAHYATAARHHR